MTAALRDTRYGGCAMLALDKCGNIVREYAGDGTLKTATEGRVACSFRLVQMANGSIYADCRAEDDPHVVFGKLKPGTNAEFAGTTDNGYQVNAKGIILSATLSGRRTTEPAATSARVRLLCEASVSVSAHDVLAPASAQFSLVNFEFTGTQGFTIVHGDGSKSMGLQLPLELGDRVVTLRRVDDYDEVLRALRAIRGVDVTCHATMPISSLDDLHDAREVVDTLCKLLTLARGTQVVWINCDVRSISGQVTKSCLRDAVTKRFGTLSTIGPDERKRTKAFVEAAFPRVAEVNDLWNLHAVVTTLTDAKSEGDCLESRALKLAVCIEMLRARFLDRQDRLAILDTEAFNSALPEIRKRLRGVLQEVLGETNGLALELMANNAAGMNHYPFRRALREMCEEVGLNLSSARRGLLVNLRNTLVHEGRLDPERGGFWSQFKTLSDFVGDFLLAAFGFDGTNGEVQQ